MGFLRIFFIFAQIIRLFLIEKERESFFFTKDVNKITKCVKKLNNYRIFVTCDAMGVLTNINQ